MKAIEMLTATLPLKSEAQATIGGSLERQPVEIKHDNQAEFGRLEEENAWLASATLTAQAAIMATVVVPEPITKAGSILAGAVATRTLLTRAKKVHEILKNGRALDEAFGDKEIQVFCDIPVPEQGRLDLFLRFPIPPQKAIFAVALRSQGQGTVVYNEGKEALYLRKGGGLKLWKPDHIERLARQESWLRQNRQAEMFGTSSRDKNRSAVKLLVLTGETKLGQHSDYLYKEIGDQRVLLLQRRSSVYVLQEEQLIPFIQGWFAQKQ